MYTSCQPCVPASSTSWVFSRYSGKQGPARPMGVRRPHQRRLHAPLRLDQHRPTPNRQGPRVTHDPQLADYWAWRRHKAPLPINLTVRRLHRAQDGRRALCKATPLAASNRPQPPRANGSNGWPPLARRSTSPGTQPTRTPLNPVSFTSPATPPASHQGLLEADAGKLARPVLRRVRRRKAPDLSDGCARPAARLGGGLAAPSSMTATPIRAPGLIQPVGPAPWKRREANTVGGDPPVPFAVLAM